MTQKFIRAAIVGASSLLGKELAEQLNLAINAVWDLALLDTEESAGQVTAAGDEPLVIQPLTPESFAGMDVVFFAADRETASEQWRIAFNAGAAIVDLSGALAGQPGTVLRAPLLAEAGWKDARLDLSIDAIVAAHPVTLMLGCVAARLLERAASGLPLAATVLLPASEQGSAGMDELHAQTVALLSFQEQPREIYGTQVAFNVTAGFGTEGSADFAGVVQRIRTEMHTLLGPAIAGRLPIQCLQAPVFHGCSASMFVPVGAAADVTALGNALHVPGLLNISEMGDDLPSNESIGEHEVMQASLQAEPGGQGVWLWLVADNVRLHVRNAIACAGELLATRPNSSRVQ